jgi:hypothetical protein
MDSQDRPPMDEYLMHCGKQDRHGSNYPYNGECVLGHCVDGVHISWVPYFRGPVYAPSSEVCVYPPELSHLPYYSRQSPPNVYVITGNNYYSYGGHPHYLYS